MIDRLFANGLGLIHTLVKVPKEAHKDSCPQMR